MLKYHFDKSAWHRIGIYRRIKEELNLTHVTANVGTEANEHADRMDMLGAQRKEEKLRRYQKKINIPTLLRKGVG